MRVQTKIKADVERVLGEKLAANLLKTRTAHMKRTPNSITFCETKPSFALSDGDILHAYGANIETGEITGERFCGSGDSAINHPEQGAEGYEAKPGYALIFVHAYWNGRNHSWVVTVVCKDLVKQLA